MRWSLRLFSVTMALLLSVACSKTERTTGSADSASSRLQPAPKNPETRESQLMRYGSLTENPQTKFLNFELTPRHFLMARTMAEGVAAPKAAGGDAGTDKRAIEDSDVFKIDGPLIYLLNSYRGIIVVSFENRAQPKIVGRAPVTKNSPKDMFFVERGGQKRLYVAENNYFNQDDDNYNTNSSRLLVYDAKVDGPTLLQELNVPGDLRAVQKAGDIIYFASMQYEPYYWTRSNTSVTGSLVSFNIDAGKEKKLETAQVDSQTFSSPLSYNWSGQEPISLVEEPLANGKFRYYALATLSKDNRWWGNDRKNLIEVFNITDPKGKMSASMVVNARGSLDERSQTAVKDGALLVVSNFTGPNGKKQIAVESFVLPGKKPTIISEEQGKLRQLYIQAELKKLSDADEQQEKYEQLVTSKEWKLRGLFINTNYGPEYAPEQVTRLVKAAPDSSVTVGGGPEEDAFIQDVRFNGNKLFTFWVPKNLRDPLDVFDISNVLDLQHIGRTLFRGYAERSFVVNYKDREFVVALGRDAPVANNPGGKTYPQVLVFEVPKDLAKANGEVEPLAQVMLKDAAQDWISFNGPDKDIEFAVTGEGKATALFQYQSPWWQPKNKKHGSGAKLVGIDFSKRGKDMIAVGDYFAPGADWLKKAFTNKGLGLVHLFSEKSLVNFENKPQFGINELVSQVELARNIQDYVTIGDVGVQIVTNYDYFDGDGKAQTSLRMVDPAKADTMGPDVLAELTIEQGYNESVVTKDGMYLFSTRYEYKEEGEGESKEYNPYTYVDLSLVSVNERKFSVVKLDTLTLEPVVEDETTDHAELTMLETAKAAQAAPKALKAKTKKAAAAMRAAASAPQAEAALVDVGRIAPRRYKRPVAVSMVQLPGGELVLKLGRDLKRVKVADKKLTTEDIDTKECLPKKDITLSVLGNRLVATAKEVLEDKSDNDELRYIRNLIAGAKIENNKLVCGKLINIPGTPVALIGKDHLITNDSHLLHTRFIDVPELDDKGKPTGKTHKQFKSQLLANDIASLKIDWDGEQARATLADLYDPSGVNITDMKVAGDKLVFIDTLQTSGNGGWWRPRPMFSRIGIGMPFMPRENQDTVLTMLSFNKQLVFKKEAYILNTDIKATSLVSIVDDSAKNGRGAFLAVALSGRKAVVIAWDDKNTVPVVQALTRVDESLKLAKETQETVTIADSGSLRYGGSKVNFTASQRSFEFPMGLYGVEQVYLK